MNFNLIQAIKRSLVAINQNNFLISKARLATKVEENDNVASDAEFLVPEREEKLENEKKYRDIIEKKRNVSRFPSEIVERRFNHQLPTIPADSVFLNKVKFFRKIYARFGEESNIDPSICWPTKNELNEMINDEKNYDLSFRRKVFLTARTTFCEYRKLIKQ